jgi:integrase
MIRKRKQKGTIFKRHGMWYVRFFEDRVIKGEVRHVRVSKQLGEVSTRGKKPPKLIQDEATRKVAEACRACANPEKVLTFGDFIEKVFFLHVQQYKRASTMHGYKAIWNNHLKPLSADVWLKDVRTYHVQEWIDVIAKSGPVKRKAAANSEPISRNYLLRMKAFVSAAFKEARRQHYYLGENPARDVAVTPKAMAPKEGFAYSLDEIAAMLTVLPEPANTVFAVAAFAGLRRGEIMGLLWENYRDGELCVTRSIWGKHVNAPKTRKSAGAVPMIKQLAERLDLYPLRCGNPQKGPMFANLSGNPTSIDNMLCRQILPALHGCMTCKKTKNDHVMADHEYKPNDSLPQWRGFHAARRGLASNLYSLGVPDIVIQNILRHSDVSVTQRCYIKPLAQSTKNAMEKLEKLLTATEMAPNQETQAKTSDETQAHRVQ